MGITEGGVTPDMPFITEYKRGKGKIVMVGSMPSGEQGTEMLRALLKHYAKEAGITIATDVTPGTIVIPREGKNTIQWVIVNMNGKGGAVTLPAQLKDAFTGEAVIDNNIKIEPYGCRVMESDKI